MKSSREWVDKLSNLEEAYSNCVPDNATTKLIEEIQEDARKEIGMKLVELRQYAILASKVMKKMEELKWPG